MLLGVLLAVWPTRVTEVVVVMVNVEPFGNVAEPVPLSVRMLSVIGVVFVDGLTVAVVGTGFCIGTKGVLPKVTVGFTLTPPPGVNLLAGHNSRQSLLLRSPLVCDVVEPMDCPVWVP